MLHAMYVSWTQNIYELELCHSKRGMDNENGKGGQDVLCAIASPPSPYLGWLAANVCICNCQRSSEISCDTYIS
jgi:hypothetical protein